MVIKENEIHVWQIDLSTLQGQLDIFWQYLSNIEQSRASKFRFEVDKNNYIIRTAILRKLLSTYKNCQPHEIEFTLGEYGKPSLIGDNLNFNLSHAKDKSLIAFTKHIEIGIDIEFIDQSIEAKKISKNFFSKEEIRQLYRLTDENLADGFFNIWTKKEAFIKALGTGLTYPLDAFDVNIVHSEQKALICLGHSFSEAKEWNLFSIPTYTNFKAAMAYRGKAKKKLYYNYI